MNTQTDASTPQAFIEALERQYEVGPHFVASYLNYWSREVGDHLASLEDVAALPAPKPMWFDYALSTNQRGHETYFALAQHLRPLARGRYLDVGCEFGGCLAAFAQNGYEVTGLQNDPQRLEFCRANGRDYGFEDRVLSLDLAQDLGEQLGSFDVITASDVIEHVADPAATLGRLVGLLAPEGTLMLRAPNKDSLAYVTADGHYGLFGLTLLGREDAAEVHQRHYHEPYGVYHYQPLEFYLRELRALGCTVQVIETPMNPPHPLAACEELTYQALGAFERFCQQPADALPAYLRLKVSVVFRKYMARLNQDLVGLGQGQGSLEAFQRKYLTDVWSVLVKRP